MICRRGKHGPKLECLRFRLQDDHDVFLAVWSDTDLDQPHFTIDGAHNGNAFISFHKETKNMNLRGVHDEVPWSALPGWTVQGFSFRFCKDCDTKKRFDRDESVSRQIRYESDKL